MIKITHTDTALTTWLEFEGETYGVDSWGNVLNRGGITFHGPASRAIIDKLEAAGFTEAARAFARENAA